MYSYNKNQDSPYDPTKLVIHSFFLRPDAEFLSNCGHVSKYTVPFEGIVHFVDEKIIVIYADFDCGITYYPEKPTKFG